MGGANFTCTLTFQTMATAVSTVESFFSELASFIDLSGSREEGATVAVAEATVLRLECYGHVLYRLMASIDEVFGKWSLAD